MGLEEGLVSLQTPGLSEGNMAATDTLPTGATTDPLQPGLASLLCCEAATLPESRPAGPRRCVVSDGEGQEEGERPRPCSVARRRARTVLGAGQHFRAFRPTPS